MSDWWEDLPLAGDQAVAEPPAGQGNWWDGLPLAEGPPTEPEAEPNAVEPTPQSVPIQSQQVPPTAPPAPNPNWRRARIPQELVDRELARIAEMPPGPERDELVAVIDEARYQNFRADADEEGRGDLHAPARRIVGAWGNLGRTIGETVSRGIGALGPDEFNRVADDLARERGYINRYLHERDAASIGELGATVGDVGQSLAEVATAGPKGMLPYLFASSGDAAYVAAKDRGVSEADAVRHGVNTGVIQAGLTWLFGRIAGKLGGQTAEEALTNPAVQKAAERLISKHGLQRLGIGVLSEAGEEGTIAAVQQLEDMRAGTGDGRDFWRNVGKAAAVGGVAGGAVHGLMRGLDSAMNKFNREAPVVADAIAAAEKFAESATPEQQQSAANATSRGAFTQATGQKQSTQQWREAFTEEVKRRLAEQRPPEAKGTVNTEPPLAIEQGLEYTGKGYPESEQPMIPTGERKTRRKLQSNGKSIDVSQVQVLTGTKRMMWIDEDQLTPFGSTEPPLLEETEEPPVAPGHVRMYHGGDQYEGGPRWLTPHRDYAEGYARGNPVQYVDIPEDSPYLVKSFEDEGADQKAPYKHFEAPEEIAKGLRPLPAPRTDNPAPATQAWQPPIDRRQLDALDRRVQKLREAGGYDIDSFDEVLSSTPQLLADVFAESDRRAAEHNLEMNAARREWGEVFGDLSAEKVRMAKKGATSDGDSTFQAWDQIVGKVTGDEDGVRYPHILAAAQALGNGDVESGLFSLLQESRKYFGNKTGDEFAGDVLNEAMEAQASFDFGANDAEFALPDDSNSARRRAPLTTAEPKEAVVARDVPASMKPMPLVEMTRIARGLLGGNYPKVRKKMEALGMFRQGKGNGPAEIAIRADQAEDPQQLAGVLAHEIGHLADWLPDRTLARGNLIGRLLSLRNHLKHVHHLRRELPSPDGGFDQAAEKTIRGELVRLSEWWRGPIPKSGSKRKYRLCKPVGSIEGPGGIDNPCFGVGRIAARASACRFGRGRSIADWQGVPKPNYRRNLPPPACRN